VFCHGGNIEEAYLYDECSDINYIWLHISHGAEYRSAFIP
jgi:hypothetical protein